MLCNRLLLVVGFVLVCSIISLARSQSAPAFRTARDLAQYCDPSGDIPGARPLDAKMTDVWQAFCVNYIVGVADTLDLAKQTGTASVCFPESLAGDELKEVVLRYFRTHPEAVQAMNGATVVRKAITAWFPCRR